MGPGPGANPDAGSQGNGMAPSPQEPAPTNSEPWFAPPSAPLPWDESEYDIAAAPEGSYALEMRAEKLGVVARGDAVRRGEVEYLRTGNGSFADTVAGEERTTIDGTLTEKVGAGSLLSADRIETTVHGRMSISAVGWSSFFSGEDGMLLGGALTDTWTGGLMIAAAMSDDLVVGAGVRLSAPVDLWLNQLTGMEERPGTAAADGVMVDLCGTLFEREYGKGVHVAGVASFSGTTYQTQRVGFRQLMKTATGVRNLIPGSGAPASEQPPPSPPSTPSGAGTGAMVVTVGAGGAGGAARSMGRWDDFQDITRVLGSVDEMEDASNLRHSADTADTLNGLSDTARTLDLEIPNGMGQMEPPPANLPEGFARTQAMSQLDDVVEARMDRIEALEGVQTSPVQQINAVIADKLDELAGVTARGNTLDMSGIPQKSDEVGSIIGSPGVVEDAADARRMELESEIAKISWPGSVASDPGAARLQLEAEIDALMGLKAALDSGEDPVAYLADLGRQAEDLYGAGDPRTIAYQTVSTYYSRITGAMRILEDEVDLYMLARAELERGLDPRVAVQNAYNAAEPGSDARRHAQGVLDYLNNSFDWGSRTADDAGAVSMPNGLGAVDAPSQADELPDYPGLPDEFSRDEFRLTVDPPSHGSLFGDAPPPAVTDNLRQSLDFDIDMPLPDWQLNGGQMDLPGAGGLGVQQGAQTRIDDVITRARGLDSAYLSGGVADDGWLEGLRGDYELMGRGQDATVQGADVSSDTQAVVAGMPTHALPDDFDYAATMAALDQHYMDHRRASNWRATLAYGDAINELRADLFQGLGDLGGDADEFANANARTLYGALEELAGGAAQAGDTAQAQRVEEFLAAHRSKTYNLFADLGQRADEFGSAGPGLDRHIDQARLLDWLTSQQMDAARRLDSAPDAQKGKISEEMAYFQQLFLAVQEGRNPLRESTDQIAYLRSVDNAAQADDFLQYQARLEEVLSDPSYHKSAAELGDTTYAPVAFLRPELGNVADADAGLGGGMSTQVFQGDAGQADAAGEASAGDYAANRDVINGFVGDGDIAQAPETQPAGIENSGPRGILTNTGEPGLVDLDSSRAINRGPDGEDVTGLSLRLWTERIHNDADLLSMRTQGGFGSYMDQVANFRPEELAEADELSTNPYAAARIEAANRLWADMVVPETRPQSQWDRFPAPHSMRTWDNGARGRKSVRFGNAEVMTVYADLEDVRKIQNQWRDVDAGDAIMPWWTGSGVNRATEPLNLDEAVRHVPTPEAGQSRSFRGSAWRASRQPGFGRLAVEPGAFPFSSRETMIADLMRGNRLDVNQVDALTGALNDAVRANRVEHKEWLKMSALLRSVRYGEVLGDTRPFARAIDWKTLDRMLNMLDSAAAMA